MSRYSLPKGGGPVSVSWSGPPRGREGWILRSLFWNVVDKCTIVPRFAVALIFGVVRRNDLPRSLLLVRSSTPTLRLVRSEPGKVFSGVCPPDPTIEDLRPGHRSKVPYCPRRRALPGEERSPPSVVRVSTGEGCNSV